MRWRGQGCRNLAGIYDLAMFEGEDLTFGFGHSFTTA